MNDVRTNTVQEVLIMRYNQQRLLPVLKVAEIIYTCTYLEENHHNPHATKKASENGFNKLE